MAVFMHMSLRRHCERTLGYIRLNCTQYIVAELKMIDAILTQGFPTTHLESLHRLSVPYVQHVSTCISLHVLRQYSWLQGWYIRTFSLTFIQAFPSMSPTTSAQLWPGLRWIHSSIIDDRCGSSMHACSVLHNYRVKCDVVGRQGRPPSASSTGWWAGLRRGSLRGRESLMTKRMKTNVSVKFLKYQVRRIVAWHNSFISLWLCGVR